MAYACLIIFFLIQLALICPQLEIETEKLESNLNVASQQLEKLEAQLKTVISQSSDSKPVEDAKAMIATAAIASTSATAADAAADAPAATRGDTEIAETATKEATAPVLVPAVGGLGSSRGKSGGGGDEDKPSSLPAGQSQAEVESTKAAVHLNGVESSPSQQQQQQQQQEEQLAPMLTMSTTPITPLEQSGNRRRESRLSKFFSCSPAKK